MNPFVLLSGGKVLEINELDGGRHRFSWKEHPLSELADQPEFIRISIEFK
jgi:hypothetical protein